MIGDALGHGEPRAVHDQVQIDPLPGTFASGHQRGDLARERDVLAQRTVDQHASVDEDGRERDGTRRRGHQVVDVPRHAVRSVVLHGHGSEVEQLGLAAVHVHGDDREPTALLDPRVRDLVE